MPALFPPRLASSAPPPRIKLNNIWSEKCCWCWCCSKWDTRNGIQKTMTKGKKKIKLNPSRNYAKENPLPLWFCVVPENNMIIFMCTHRYKGWCSIYGSPLRVYAAVDWAPLSLPLATMGQYSYYSRWLLLLMTMTTTMTMTLMAMMLLGCLQQHRSPLLRRQRRRLLPRQRRRPLLMQLPPQ